MKADAVRWLFWVAKELVDNVAVAEPLAVAEELVCVPVLLNASRRSRFTVKLEASSAFTLAMAPRPSMATSLSLWVLV